MCLSGSEVRPILVHGDVVDLFGSADWDLFVEGELDKESFSCRIDGG